jgi:hypothetical protein
MIFVICQAALLYDRDNDDDTFELNNQFKSLTPQQLAELDEFLSRKLEDESSSGEILYRNTRRPHEKFNVKRNSFMDKDRRT